MIEVETVRWGDLHKILNDQSAVGILVGRQDAMVAKAKQAISDGNFLEAMVPVVRSGFRTRKKAITVSLSLLREMGIRMPASEMGRPMTFPLGGIFVDLLPALVITANDVLGVIVPAGTEEAQPS